MTSQQALAFISQALTDFSNTMQPSVRGPFVRVADDAVRALAPQQPAPPSDQAHAADKAGKSKA